MGNICPSCGRRYNGKRCRNCMYENFTEEIAHGLHTHEGEPLVVDAPARKPIPARDPFGCDKKTRKAPARRGIPVLAVLMIWAAGMLLFNMTSLVSQGKELVSGFTEEALPDPEIPEDGTVLYHQDGILITAQLPDSRPSSDGIRLVIQNSTGRDFTVYAQNIVANGYVLEDSWLYCSVERGHTAETYFTLEQSDLDRAGIETVQQLSVELVVYDADDYDTLAETGMLDLYSAQEITQTVDDSGVLLLEQDGIRVICRGYVPGEYAPEEFTSGVVQFFLENDTDLYLEAFTQEVCVNGEDIWLSLWCALPPHTRAVRSMYLYGLEELGIESREDVREMVMTLDFFVRDDYQAYLSTGPISIPLDGT